MKKRKIGLAETYVLPIAAVTIVAVASVEDGENFVRAEIKEVK